MTTKLIRMRGLTGRWPVQQEQTAGRRVPQEGARRRSRPRHKRVVPNTRRGVTGGKSISTRGRRGVIVRQPRGSANYEFT